MNTSTSFRLIFCIHVVLTHLVDFRFNQPQYFLIRCLEMYINLYIFWFRVHLVYIYIYIYIFFLLMPGTIIFFSSFGAFLVQVVEAVLPFFFLLCFSKWLKMDSTIFLLFLLFLFLPDTGVTQFAQRARPFRFIRQIITIEQTRGLLDRKLSHAIGILDEDVFNGVGLRSIIETENSTV